MTTPRSPSVKDLADKPASTRNKAIDFYRVVAMLAVAIGHWIAIVAIQEGDAPQLGNALSYLPSLAWITWLLQVMPLFFIVGGFSSAASLDAHNRNGGRPQDWVANRLRRMLPPAVRLASFWLTVLIAATVGSIVFDAPRLLELAVAGAWAAAIPLWFLANYTIDTAIAPYVLPKLRRDPAMFVASLVCFFAVFELCRIIGGPLGFLAHANWVLGWLLFQVIGMAWRDGLLPTGIRLAGIAVGLWAAAAFVVLSGGPWQISMVNTPGLENSPTNPPNLALLLFGCAYGATAIAAAPIVSRWLDRSPKAWTLTVAGNGVAMTVYLWHMTAAVIVIAFMHLTTGLPEVAVGSSQWWLMKLPTMAASTAVLAVLIGLFGKVEREALFAPKRPWNGGPVSMLATAAVASAALKLWTSGDFILIVPSLTVLVVVGGTTLSHRNFLKNSGIAARINSAKEVFSPSAHRLREVPSSGGLQGKEFRHARHR